MTAFMQQFSHYFCFVKSIPASVSPHASTNAAFLKPSQLSCALLVLPSLMEVLWYEQIILQLSRLSVLHLVSYFNMFPLIKDFCIHFIKYCQVLCSDMFTNKQHVKKLPHTVTVMFPSHAQVLGLSLTLLLWESSQWPDSA